MKQPEWVEIDMELPPYLIKYASAGHEGNYLVLKGNETCHLWEAVTARLGIPPSGWRPRRIPPNRKLTLRIPAWYVKDHSLGCWVSEDRKKFLARLVEIAFWKELYYTVMEERLKGEKELVAIRRFRAEYGISEDDFKLESMHKRHRRIKEKRKRRTETVSWRAM